MKNLLKWQLLVIVGCVVFGCNEDPLTGSLSDDLIIEGRSSECDRSISFSKKITSYVSFDVPDSELTMGEKLLKIPKSDLREFTFCETQDGNVNISVAQNPNLGNNTDYDARILGAPRKISWQSEKVLFADELSAGFDQVVETYQSGLVDETTYNYFVEALRQNMTVEDLNENLIVVSTDTGDGISKSYFDKRCQKEVAMEIYDYDNNLISRSSKLYSVNGNMVYLATTIKTAFKKSPDSDHIMSLITVSNYQMH